MHVTVISAADLFACIIVAGVWTLFLTVKSVKDFTRTGPQLQREILAHYRFHAAYAVLRLAGYAFLLAFVLAFAGVFVLRMLAIASSTPLHPALAYAAASVGLLGATSLRLLWVLRHSPATVVASSQYDLTRLRHVWMFFTPGRLRAALGALSIGVLGLLAGAIHALFREQEWGNLILVLAVALLALTSWHLALRDRAPSPARAVRQRSGGAPNILMIGSDTLRADRLGVNGYYRSLTPRIDALARQGALFTQCFVPCARTSPSLVSLLSGCWPHTHGVRDNYVAGEETRLRVPLLPRLLRDAGYETVAVGDWAASDFSKFDFGFDRVRTPPDQWNIKYLLRQGPKDLRLFLSLFCENALGRLLLPEVYYLGGVPRTRQVGLETRREINRLAIAGRRPFLLTMFAAATHPPFGSELPYYTLFADPNYHGESLFAMARLTDPFDIIRRQGEPRKEFDLEQIEDLYDGCVRSFDDEVGRLLVHLKQCGLAENTIVVIFSDHGMEFFEHGTWGQGNSVFGNQSNRVPLVIHDPRRKSGFRIDTTVRSIDVAPTLLGLLDLPAPKDMDGCSLASSVRSGTPPRPLTALGETGYWLTDLPGTPPGHLRYPALPDLLYVPDRHTGTLALKEQFKRIVVDAKDRMVISGDWKLTYQPLHSGALIKLFDLKTDSDCRHDVSARFPEVATRLEGELRQWLEKDAMATTEIHDEKIRTVIKVAAAD